MTVLLGLEIRFDFLSLMDPVTRRVPSCLRLAGPSGDAASAPSSSRPLRRTGGSATQPVRAAGHGDGLAQPGRSSFYGTFRLVTALLTAAVLATAVIACWRAWGGRAATVLLPCCPVLRVAQRVRLEHLLAAVDDAAAGTLVPLLVWPRLGHGPRQMAARRPRSSRPRLPQVPCAATSSSARSCWRWPPEWPSTSSEAGSTVRFIWSVWWPGSIRSRGFLAALARSRRPARSRCSASVGPHPPARRRADLRPTTPRPVLDRSLRSWHEPVCGWLVADSDNPFRGCGCSR